jgi:negative regulator of flagellin synthesis FlgM
LKKYPKVLRTSADVASVQVNKQRSNVMKIDKSTPPLPASQIGELAPRSPNAKPARGSSEGNAASSSTSVHLGSSTAQLQSLGKSVANASVVDAEKVAAIKQAISEGRFKVNHEVVADRLIDSVKELINANTHKA